jgi:hypothetical protein
MTPPGFALHEALGKHNIKHEYYAVSTSPAGLRTSSGR